MHLTIFMAAWPWYVAGPLIGLTVPLLLLMGNKTFGISSSLRHVCAACVPGNIAFFRYDWRKEKWNLLFAAGIFAGALLVTMLFPNVDPIRVNEKLASELAGYGIYDLNNMLPNELFSWKSLLTAKGLIIMVAGGFLVGFGTRYAGGCTSGHAIMGLSNLQWPSLIATLSFMAGGFAMANLVMPLLFKFL